MKGITDTELMNRLQWPVMRCIVDLEGKCKHCGELTDPAYSDATTRVLHNLEEKGWIAGDGGYWRKGAHGGAGARKWKLTDLGRDKWRAWHD